MSRAQRPALACPPTQRGTLCHLPTLPLCRCLRTARYTPPTDLPPMRTTAVGSRLAGERRRERCGREQAWLHPPPTLPSVARGGRPPSHPFPRMPSRPTPCVAAMASAPAPGTESWSSACMRATGTATAAKVAAPICRPPSSPSLWRPPPPRPHPTPPPGPGLSWPPTCRPFRGSAAATPLASTASFRRCTRRLRTPRSATRRHAPARPPPCCGPNHRQLPAARMRRRRRRCRARQQLQPAPLVSPLFSLGRDPQEPLL